jgi:NADPH:quinone reductase-like Zn-dependent oxidoreductase
MRAARIHHFGGPEAIAIEDIPVPEPGPGEIRIRVHVASVNPVDYKIREGKFLPEDKLPLTLGRDVSGTVDQIGEGAGDEFQPGDTVFAMLPPDSGGYAEFAVARAEHCARCPNRLDDVGAGSLGLAGLTAWQGLFDHGGLRAGQRVLIHGAAGGVGHLAVQFARARGAEVLATCAGEDADFVRGLGAKEVIDYKSERFEDRARDIDLVFDLVAGETQDRSWSVLRDGGTLISTLSEPDKDKAAQHHARGARYMARPNGAELKEIAGLIDAGEVTPKVDRVFPLEAAAEAQRVLEQEHSCGKIVLKVA